MSDAENISKVTDIINDSRIGMFTTVNEEGALVSRPLAVQDVKDDGDMWFFTSATTSQVAHVRAHPGVNVSFGKGTEWVSVAGTAEVVTDRQKIHELWNQMVEAWFPDGPDTPEVVLLHVDSDSAEYWTSPGGTAATVLQWVKSKVLHSRMSVGESGTVELFYRRRPPWFGAAPRGAGARGGSAPPPRGYRRRTSR